MKLGIVASNTTSPSSFYRALGPLAPMAREHGIELMLSDVWDWSRLLYCDALFMHCPLTAEHVQLAELCRQTHTPLWIDHDDDVTSLTRDNGGYGMIMHPEVQRNIQRCLDLADVVTVSTPALQAALCPRAEIIPNALNEQIFPFSDAPREKVITWRGGPAHHSDLEHFAPALGRVAAKHPDWKFHFCGVVWWGLERFMPAGSFVLHPWAELLDYCELLTKLRPAVHVVPMLPTAFNLAKSNCAWLEATAAGAVTVAPDWSEWGCPGILGYNAHCDLEARIEHAMDPRANSLQLSREYITNNLLLSHINHQRLAVLTKLTAARKTHYGKLE